MRVRFFPGHFPFPVAIAPSFSDALRVPLDVAMRWYWRVQEWSATIVVSAVVVKRNSSGGIIATLSLDALTVTQYLLMQPVGFGELHRDPAISENDLVAPVHAATLHHGPPVITGTVILDPPEPSPPATAASIDFGYIGFDDTPIRMTVDPESGLYTPFTQVAGSVSAISSRSLGIGVSTGPQPPDPGTFGPHPTTFVGIPTLVDGYSTTTAGYFDSGGFEVQGFSAGLVFTPHLYWQYKTLSSGGQALFDSNTEDPLTDPATGTRFTLAAIAAAPWP